MFKIKRSIFMSKNGKDVDIPKFSYLITKIKMVFSILSIICWKTAVLCASSTVVNINNNRKSKKSLCWLEHNVSNLNHAKNRSTFRFICVTKRACITYSYSSKEHFNLLIFSKLKCHLAKSNHVNNRMHQFRRNNLTV